MTEISLSPERAKALLGLLDDDSPFVQKALAEELKRLSGSGEAFLREISQGLDASLAVRARELLNELGWADGVQAFLEFIRSLKYELETGWFLLDRAVYPTCDIAACHLFLDEIAERCRELMTPPTSAREQCRIMNRVFFHEYGFRGATKDFSDPENSFLHKVVERRRGLPITLSVIYLLVARRIGMELEPIGLPGRFMVGCFTEEPPFYIDVWAGGRFREAHELEAFLGDSPSDQSGGYLLPVTVAETLSRGCRNLAMHYRQAGNTELAGLFLRFVSEFDSALRREANA